jgi:hypothetical protein
VLCELCVKQIFSHAEPAEAAELLLFALLPVPWSVGGIRLSFACSASSA